MRQVIPYRTVAGALHALDNGGRFYNLFTKSGDGRITNSELLRAAGIVSGRDQAFLFFGLALSLLNEQQREVIIARLDPKLQTQHAKAQPLHVDLAECATSVKPGRAVVVGGYPRFVEDRTQFSYFVMIPVTSGGTTTFTMIPIFDQFDVYELYSGPEISGEGTLIAIARGKRRLEQSRILLGEIVRELKFETKAKSRPRTFVEALYYIGESALATA